MPNIVSVQKFKSFFTQLLNNELSLNQGKQLLKDFDFNEASLEALKGDDAKTNAQTTKAILNGKFKGARFDIVLLDAATALIVAEKCDNIQSGIQIAKNIIDTGLAKAQLEKVLKFFL